MAIDLSTSVRRMRFPIRPLRVSEILLVFQYGLYFIALLSIYIFGIAPRYSYMGFLDAFDTTNLVISAFIFACVIPFLRPGELPSAFFLNMAASLVLVPTLVIYTGAGLPHRYALITASALLLIAITSKTLRLRPFKHPLIRPSRLLQLLGFLSVATVVGIFLFGGARFLSFDFSAVYTLRREAAQNLPGIFGYLIPWVTKVAIPFAIVFAMRDRRWLATAVFISISVLIFGLTAHKSPLFYPVLVVFVFFIVRSRYVVQYFLAALVMIILVSAIDIWFFFQNEDGLSGWFASLLTRRAILVPSLLNWYYLDFFSDAEKYFWAGSRLTFGLIDSPFHLRSVNLIGLEYFGKEEMSANTGWVGSGYANAGLWGIMLYSVLTGVLLAFLDCYARRLGTSMVVALFVLPIFTILTSTDFTTMLLTHGLVFSIILLILTKPTTQSED